MILSAASAAAWLRSYQASDAILFMSFRKMNPGGIYGVTSAGYERGALLVYDQTVRQPSPRSFRRQAVDLPRAFRETGVRLGLSNVPQARFGTVPVPAPKTRTLTIAGIEAEIESGLAMLESLEIAENRRFRIPLAYPALGLAALPAFWVMRWRKRRAIQLRMVNGQCVQCGYDLRHSLHNCPECGLSVPGRVDAAPAPPRRGRSILLTFVLAMLVLACSVLMSFECWRRLQYSPSVPIEVLDALSDELFSAIEASDSARVSAVLDRGADPSEDGALHLAVRRGDAAMVRLLLDRGGAVDGSEFFPLGDGNHTPLADAALSGNLELAPLLLERGADWRKVEFPKALARILWDPRSAAARFIQDPDAQDDSGNALIHLAAIGGNSDALRDLIGRGARVDARTANGLTPAHFAAMRVNDVKCLEILLAHAADLNVEDTSKRRPLDKAKDSLKSQNYSHYPEISLWRIFFEPRSSFEPSGFGSRPSLWPVQSARHAKTSPVIEWLIRHGATEGAQPRP